MENVTRWGLVVFAIWFFGCRLLPADYKKKLAHLVLEANYTPLFIPSTIEEPKMLINVYSLQKAVVLAVLV